MDLSNLRLSPYQQKILHVFNCTSDEPPEILKHAIYSRGFPYDKSLPYGTKTIPMNLAAQYQRYDNMAVLAQKALEDGRPELLEAGDTVGRSPAYLSVCKANPECLGVMAKAGARLDRAIPVTWEVPNANGGLTDPQPKSLKVHHALNQTVLSFVTDTCCKCFKDCETELAQSPSSLKKCSRCQMAKYCSKECQTSDWKSHKLVCKRIKKGADLLTFNSSIPDPMLMPPPMDMDDTNFQPFEQTDWEDSDVDDDDDPEDYFDTTIIWEYFDANSRKWTRYPLKIERGIEGLREAESPRYMYKPGNKKACGKEERTKSTNPPRDVATNHIYYSDMIDRQIYTGAGRRVRRRGGKKDKENVCSDSFLSDLS